ILLQGDRTYSEITQATPGQLKTGHFPQLSEAPPTTSTSTNGLDYATKLKTINIKIIPPFTKENFKNLQGSFRLCASAIMAKFPPGINNKITITKIFTKIREKNLHTILVTAPLEAKSYISEIQSRGIELLGKTVFPLGARLPLQSEANKIRKSYPRVAKIKFVNLPLQCEPDEVLQQANLPEQAKILDEPERQVETTDHGQFYTGRACVSVSIPNKETEDELRIWSRERRLGDAFLWEDIPILFHVPSLHHCTFCRTKGKHPMGHESEWCLERIREEKLKHAREREEKESESEETSSEESCESSGEEEDQVNDKEEEERTVEEPVEQPSEEEEKPAKEEKFRKVKAKRRKGMKRNGIKNKKSKKSTSPHKNGAL
ncbi:MAG: hypothetical protein AAF757_21980, partial [Cyanobacteria bacterium P01_D01_bin.116]